MTATRRLDVGLRAIGLAFDRDGITVAAAAEELGVSEGFLTDAIQPFTDLEYIHASGQLLDDIGHVVTVADGSIEVLQNWMQDLASLTPGDAALLLAMIETAGHIDGVSIEALRSLRRRLDAIAHVSVREAVPPAVADLINAKHAGQVISARFEGSDMRVAGEPSLYEVHQVQWTDSGWQVLVTLYGDTDTEVANLPAERFHDISGTQQKFERRSLTVPEYVSRGRSELVEIEYPVDRTWLLAYFGPKVLSHDREVATCRIRIDTGRSLSRLMLRLGPEARIVSPPHLVSRGGDEAASILGMYRSED